MYKKVFGRKLSRNRNSRKALFRSLIRAIVIEGKISTTRAKAKAVQPDIDKIMKLVAAGDLNARRRVLAMMGNDRAVVDRLFADYVSVAQSRKSGYTRIINLPPRTGDNANMVNIEWIAEPIAKPAPSAKNRDKAKTAAKPKISVKAEKTKEDKPKTKRIKK